MAQGSLSPAPWFQPVDVNGNPYPGALLFTYDSGTTVKRATYTDAGLLVAHPNPIVMDAAGRAVIYLSPTSYRFVLAPSNDVDPPLAPIKTVDPVGAIPLTNVDLDILGTAGENLVFAEAVYLSDGSGGLTAGRWYKASAANAYSSSMAKAVGIMPADLASGVEGAIRRAGRLTGGSGLTAGTLYYISVTPGQITATAPGNRRVLLVAESATASVLIAANRETALRCVAHFTATVGNVGAGEDILATYTAPALELHTDGMTYKGVFWGHTTNNANAKALRARIIEGANNNQLAGLACTVNEAGSWVLTFEAKRFSSVLAIYQGQASVGPSLAATTISTNNVFGGTITWANAVEIRVTGEATTNNDITVEGGTITIVPPAV